MNFDPHELNEHFPDLPTMARHFRPVISGTKEEYVRVAGPGDLVPLIMFGYKDHAGIAMPMGDDDDNSICYLPDLLGQVRAKNGTPKWVVYIVEALDFYEDTPDGPRTTPPGPLDRLWKRGDKRVRECVMAFYGTADRALMEVMPYRYGGGSVEWMETRSRFIADHESQVLGDTLVSTEHLVLEAFQVLFMTPEVN